MNDRLVWAFSLKAPKLLRLRSWAGGGAREAEDASGAGIRADEAAEEPVPERDTRGWEPTILARCEVEDVAEVLEKDICRR